MLQGLTVAVLPLIKTKSVLGKQPWALGDALMVEIPCHSLMNAEDGHRLVAGLTDGVYNMAGLSNACEVASFERFLIQVSNFWKMNCHSAPLAHTGCV